MVSLVPKRLPPQRKPHSELAFTGGLINCPCEGDIIYSHADMRIMDPLFVALAPGFPAQDQISNVGIDIIVTEKSLLVHDGRRRDPTMFANFPIIGDDFLALLDQSEFTFMTRQLHCYRTSLDLPGEHEGFVCRGHSQSHVGVGKSLIARFSRPHRRSPKLPAILSNGLG